MFLNYFYNILFFIVVHESPISHFKGFSIEGTHSNNSMWERFLIVAQGLLRGQRQDSSQCPLGSYDKKEGFLCDLKFLICNVCDSFISNVFQVFLTAFYSFLLFTRFSFLILKDFSLKERTVTHCW